MNAQVVKKLFTFATQEEGQRPRRIARKDALLCDPRQVSLKVIDADSFGVRLGTATRLYKVILRTFASPGAGLRRRVHAKPEGGDTSWLNCNATRRAVGR
jgi:hypothetical protein